MKLIVTGANGALGVATANLLERKGHCVARIVRNTRQEGPLTFACRDLANAEEFDETVALATERLGGLDGVLHLAGAFRWMPILESDVALWRSLFRDNLETTLNVVKAAVPRLNPDGAIVTVGAAAADPSGAGMAAYAASKSAVARVTQSLARELVPGRCRINTLLPGIIDTPANRKDMADADPAAWTHPDAIAEVAAFLISPDARAINGALIPVSNAVAS